ncbi:MAG: hypothetical protein DRJ61_08120 [Acidobacteria bacterium]|nr:MAG: hypothetical protein DRJ61_08120 [Acidobacteriota bacterium]
MKSLRLMMMAVALIAVLAACGGAPQEQPASAEESQVAEPTPVFQDDFETGKAEGWTEADEAQAEGSEEAPTE